MKAVEISEASLYRSAPPDPIPANVASSGHRKSNSLDRPVRPPWTLGIDPKVVSAMMATEISSSSGGTIENESFDQGFSASASELERTGQLHEPEDVQTTKSATLPRPQQRVLPPPVPTKSAATYQRPVDLDLEDIAPTMVRVMPSDDSDDEEPVVEEAGRGGRKSDTSSNESKGRLSTDETPGNAPQPMPRRLPTSPKEVSYVSVAGDVENADQTPTTPARTPIGDSTGFQAESASAAPMRPKPPVPSKPRGLESPEKDSIIRL